jgi:DNA/RNA endonuclease G (NUC1)
MQRPDLVLVTTILIVAAGAANVRAQEEFPSEANDPATCSTLWETIGLPLYLDGERKQSTDEADSPTTIVCHTRYIVSHNNTNNVPDWVIERLPKSQVSGPNKRPKSIKFKRDAALPKDIGAIDDQYVGAKPFDRGHQAPSEDFNVDIDLMKESFILSNAVPQQGQGFNQDVWANLEERVRNVARARGEAYAITGPIYADDRSGGIKAKDNVCGNAIDLKPLTRTAICGDKAKCDVKDKTKVSIPIGLYKIVYDPKLKRTNAYIMPNIDHRPLRDGTTMDTYLNKFRVPVSVVEAHTGIRFFPDMTTRDRRTQLETCVATMLR